MKIAICSDELYSIHDFCVRELEARGHVVRMFGAIASRREEPWTRVCLEAASAVARGECDEGIFFCYTGTGASIAANKTTGIRAALCVDAHTAAGARKWNHANVLALSNRLISIDTLREILDAWFETLPDPNQLDLLKSLEIHVDVH